MSDQAQPKEPRVKSPHEAALPAFAKGGRALEKAQALDREGHAEATMAAGGSKPGQHKQPFLSPGSNEKQ